MEKSSETSAVLINPIPLRQLAENREMLFHGDLSQGWIKTLFEEFSEPTEPENTLPLNLEIDCEVIRTRDPRLKENIVITGNIQGSYNLKCIRCLEDTAFPLDVNFEACFLSRHLEKDPEFENQISVFHHNQEYDLYFYEQKELNLSDMIHEYLYLNREPIPLHHPDCLGLCQTCGENLNKTTCKHHTAL